MTPNELPASFQRSSLEGKVAVVTGSTQGLGEATARLFLERGCKGLVLTGRNEERGRRLAKELTTQTCRTIFVAADLQDMEDVRNIMKVTDSTFGTLDILVNAAATTDRGSLWDTTPEDYDRIMNVNTRAPFFLTQDAVRIMERNKVEGSIINISSTASYGSMPMLAAYGMSKGALNVATKNAAYSLMWSKIRVNALAIGWMDTPGEDAIQRKLHTTSSTSNWKAEGESQQPFGRLLQPDEVARCIAFCASEESGMMTGCVIDFDQSVWGAGNAPVPPRKEEWAKAHGMTFSFDQTETQTQTQPLKSSKPSKYSKKTAGVLTSRSPRGTPRSTPKSSPKTSKSPLTKRRSKEEQEPAKEQPFVPNLPLDPDISDSDDEDEDTSPPSSTETSDVSDTDEKDMVKPKSSRESTPSASPKPPTKKTLTAVEEYKLMRKLQEAGDDSKPDDYLPGSDPFAGSQDQKDRAKKKYGGISSSSHIVGSSTHIDVPPPPRASSSLSPMPPRSRRSPTSYQRKLQDASDHGPRPEEFFAGNDLPYGKKPEGRKKLVRGSDKDYRAAKVEDWLGGPEGKNQRRSYKVKKIRNVANEAN